VPFGEKARDSWREACALKTSKKAPSYFKIAFSRRIKEAAQDLLCWEGKEKTDALYDDLKGFGYPHKIISQRYR
jgi:hypothetical protein